MYNNIILQAPIGDDNYLRMAAQLRTSTTTTSGASNAGSDPSGGAQHSATGVENQSAPVSAFYLDN